MKEAAGYILLCARDDDWSVLLLRNARHHTWGFPKGHLEPGESARDGALRELEEETGITKLVPITDFESITTYRPRFAGAEALEPDDIPEKRVRYFLATVPKPTLVRSKEHDAGGGCFPKKRARCSAMKTFDASSGTRLRACVAADCC